MADLTIKVPDVFAASFRSLDEIEFDEETIMSLVRGVLYASQYDVQRLVEADDDLDPAEVRRLATRLEACAAALEATNGTTVPGATSVPNHHT